MSSVNICVGAATTRHAWSASLWWWLRPVLMVMGPRNLLAAIYCALFGEQNLYSVFSSLRLETLCEQNLKAEPGGNFNGKTNVEPRVPQKTKDVRLYIERMWKDFVNMREIN